MSRGYLNEDLKDVMDLGGDGESRLGRRIIKCKIPNSVVFLECLRNSKEVERARVE